MTEEKDIQYDFRNVPPSYAVCFNTACVKGGECLRRLAAQHVPQKRLFGPAVYPSTWAEGNCPLFEGLRETVRCLKPVSLNEWLGDSPVCLLM